MVNITINEQNFAYVGNEAKVAYGIINIILAVFTTISNTLVLFVIYKNPALRTRSSILLASLAVSDLLVGILLEPLTSLMLLSTTIQKLKIINLSRRFISVLSVGASIGSIVVISYDRYVHLSHTLHYLDVMTKRKIIIALTISWASPIIVPAFRLITKDEKVHSTVIVIFVIIYLILTIVSYVGTMCLVRRKEKQILKPEQCNKQISNSLRAAKAIALIITFLLLMVTPIAIYNFVLAAHDFGVSGLEWFAGSRRDDFYVFSITLVQANSAVNPVIYYLRTPGFQRAFTRMGFGSVISSRSRDNTL